ncbi:MAG: ribonuclease HII [Acidobacteriota bacterium]|nr:ribonuclease HII [Acidobacteriota bacterium]MDH3525573.1 ribonuclease HII [Acidobacteriota bacterium]
MGQLLAETCRLRLLSGVDELFAGYGFENCAGVDEAGRGALAGPVVAAAVIVDPGRLVPGVDDSKALTAAARERLADGIKSSVKAFSSVAIGAATIERINILEATRRAMHGALAGLSPEPDCALVDAVRLDTEFPAVGLVAGDRLCYSVAAASILAKCQRDRVMAELDRRYPQYGFAKNKGYAAPEHLEALREYGPCPEHRLTFRSVLPRRGEELH